jgi:GMP synthase-like glutamine amidotransferase
MKIGLLICDLPAEPVLNEDGDYVKIFKDTFKIPLVPFQVFKGELPAEKELNDYDAFIITGSSSSAYDQKEWIKVFIEFLRKVHQITKIKIVGICFGFQILSLALGGKVVKNERGWEVGPTLLNLNGMRIQSMHQDVVSDLPKGNYIIQMGNGY